MVIGGKCPYHWTLTFFGLPNDYRKTLHEEIFTLIYYGNGGFSHYDVYNMPVYLRKFYYSKLLESKKIEKDEIDKSMKKRNTTIHKPNLGSKFPR